MARRAVLPRPFNKSRGVAITVAFSPPPRQGVPVVHGDDDDDDDDRWLSSLWPPSPISRCNHHHDHIPRFWGSTRRASPLSLSLFLSALSVFSLLRSIMKQPRVKAIIRTNRRFHYGLFVSRAVVRSLLQNSSELDDFCATPNDGSGRASREEVETNPFQRLHGESSRWFERVGVIRMTVFLLRTIALCFCACIENYKLYAFLPFLQIV